MALLDRCNGWMTLHAVLEGRWLLLLRVFAETNFLTIAALRSEAGVSSVVVSPGYGPPGADTVERIAHAAAALFSNVVALRLHDGSQILAWLYGADLPDVDMQIAELPELRRCVGCGSLVHRSQFTPATGRCKPCHNARKRQYSNPRAAKFRQLILSMLAALRAKDPELAQALTRVLSDPAAAITGPRIERASAGQVKARDFTRRLQDAIGLNKRTIPLVALLGALAATGNARAEVRNRSLPPPHGRLRRPRMDRDPSSENDLSGADLPRPRPVLRARPAAPARRRRGAGQRAHLINWVEFDPCRICKQRPAERPNGWPDGLASMPCNECSRNGAACRAEGHPYGCDGTCVRCGAAQPPGDLLANMAARLASGGHL